MGLGLPYGIQPVNPVPVDTWSGPYVAATLADAIALANATIQAGVRFRTMEVRLIVGTNDYKYWYVGGTADSNLVEFKPVQNVDLSNYYTIEQVDKIISDVIQQFGKVYPIKGIIQTNQQQFFRPGDVDITGSNVWQHRLYLGTTKAALEPEFDYTIEADQYRFSTEVTSLIEAGMRIFGTYQTHKVEPVLLSNRFVESDYVDDYFI